MPVARQRKTKKDAPSIAVLFEHLEVPLLRYACALVKRPEVAQDLVQDAFLKLQSCWEKVASPKPWLYKTIYNLALNYQRKERRNLPLSEVETAAWDPIPDEHLARLETIGQLRLLLNSLDPQKQELLRLKFEEGLSYKAIAKRTGISVGNVGYKLHHILKSLSSKIKEIGNP